MNRIKAVSLGLLAALLLTVPAMGQGPSVQVQKWVLGQSAQTQEVSAMREQYIHRIAFSTTGSPTSVAIVVNGCNDGYCEWIGEWDTAQTGNIIVLGFYGRLQFTPTFSGGTAPTILITTVSYDGDGWGLSTQYTPTQLGINAQTVAISGTSTYTPLLTLNGVRSLAVMAKCDQTFHIAAKVYADDGTTIMYNGNLVTSGTLGTWNKLSITEQSASVDFGGGTVTAGSALRLPIKAIQFAVVNTNGAATASCTLRILTQY
jgi:hypothetical protein